MEKVIKRIFCVLMCLIILFLFLVSIFFLSMYVDCGGNEPTYYEKNVKRHQHDMEKGYQRPEFSTKYTEEEHIERLHELAMEKLYRKYGSNGYRYEIYTIYSFQLEPEYFLIQEYAQHLISNKLVEEPCRYWMGFIENDEYYIIVNDFYGSIIYYSEDIENSLYINWKDERAYLGENPYSINGVLDKKKFYGGFGQFAWIANDMLYVLDSFEEYGSRAIFVRFSDPKPFDLGGFKECRFVYYDQRVRFKEFKQLFDYSKK